MSLLALIGIGNALAADPVAAPHQGSILSLLPMIVIFIVIFYFFMIRPQSKRMREHKKLMADLAVGDEIVTSGGLVGRISRLKENFVILVTAKNVEVVVQKSAVTSVLPKGTLDSLA